MRFYPLNPTDLLQYGYTFEVSRWTDVPLGPADRVLYQYPRCGYVLIARAPVCQ